MNQEELKNIENKLRLNSPEQIEEALQYYGNLYRDEENRRIRIEARGNLLIASASIIIAFITGFLCIILYDMESISLLFLIIILTVYIVIAAFIINSIFTALEINKFEKHTMTDKPNKQYTNYNITESDVAQIRKVRAINYYILYDKNKQINDNKENFLHKSQYNIKNAIIVLLFIPLVFIVNMAFSGKINVTYLNKLRGFFQ